MIRLLQCSACLLIVAVLSYFLPATGAAISRRLAGALRSIAASPLRAILFAAATSVVVSVLLATIAGRPLPEIHDEFANLLAADTFASGRLTNPTPRDWQSFETMHELMQPTYMSKFGPGMGMILALGQVICGEPFLGLAIAAALATAAITWCLLGFFSRGWRLAGGLLAATHPAIIVWTHEYWGGNVGAIGGALVLGALVRIHGVLLGKDDAIPDESGVRCSPRSVPALAVVLAIGLGVLATVRPYEATVWGLFAAACLAYLLLRTHAHRIKTAARIAIPAALVLMSFAAFMAYYNWRITGNPMQLPYTLHAKQSMSVPLFLWQKIGPPRTYSNPQFEEQFNVFERNWFLEARTTKGWLLWMMRKAFTFGSAHIAGNVMIALGCIAGIVALCLRRRSRDPRLHLVALAAACFVAAYMIIPWFEQHYTGPSLALLFVFALWGLKWLHDARDRRARPIGAAMLGFATLFVVLYVGETIRAQRGANREGYGFDRAALIAKLESGGDRNLVLVHYAANHPTAYEWVFNRADLPNAKVLFARSLSPEWDDAVLRDYGPGRKVWRLDADEKPPRLQPLDPNMPKP